MGKGLGFGGAAPCRPTTFHHHHPPPPFTLHHPSLYQVWNSVRGILGLEAPADIGLVTKVGVALPAT